MGLLSIFSGQEEKISIADFVYDNKKTGIGIFNCKIEDGSIADFIMQGENSRIIYINGDGKVKFFDYFNGNGETRKRRKQFLRKVHSTILDYCSCITSLDVLINNENMYIFSDNIYGFGISAENVGGNLFSGDLCKAINIAKLEYAQNIRNEYQKLKNQNYTYDEIFNKLQNHIVRLSIEAVKKFENEYSLPEAEALPCTVR